MAANAEGLEWRQARQYLISSGVIPPTHRITKPDVDLVDFARSLRDGVFLCGLLNKMKPNCVEDWSPRPLMQHSYLRNIAAFLQACQKHFNLQDLFVETDLYEVDNFKKVMQVLSRLSHSPEALGLGWVPFPRKEQRNYYNQLPNEESIYASLQEVTSSHDRLYANVEELYDTNPEEDEDPYSYGNESIYDSICYYQAQPQTGKPTTDVDEKKSFILAELYETEKNVVRVLTLICRSYHGAVKTLISAEDCILLFDTAQTLYPVHCNLLEGLERSQEIKNDSSRAVADVTQHFLNQHSGFLHYGQYAVRLPFAIEKVKLLQTRGDTAKAMMSVQLNSGPSERKFPLSDLLNVPIQRVLKYPLLMKELLKCVQKQSLPSSQAEKVNLNTVIDQLEDLAKYINSTKGDAEDMKQIEEVEQSFSEPLRTPLLQCGRYRLDGELKVKAPGDNGSSKKWIFLFDKVMLVCRKPRAVFDQRYVVKTVYEVAQLRVEPMLHQPRTKGQFGLQIFYGGNVEIEVFAKTDEMKKRWMDAIKQAKEVIAPQNSNRGNHSFELTTFEEASLCDVCSKLLCGCYFQGYYCQACKKSSHYTCLGSVRACSSMHPPALPPSRHPALAPRHSLQGTEPPPPSPRNQFPRRGTSLHEPDIHGGHSTVFVAKQRYDAIGHRQSRILTFDRGEELDVVNPVPGSEWWEATSLRTGRQGEVPSSYLSRKHDDHLEVMSEEERIRTFSWFIGKMSRIEAEQCLHRMKDGVFLIRESDARQGEYAVALRWKRMPKHIKICKHPDTKRFYVSDVTDFQSVWELVSYYQTNSLGTSFPGVDTTLQVPYKEVDLRSRGGSNMTSAPAPPPLPPSRGNPPIHSPQPHHEKELWAEVLFDFSSEFPDEMSIEKHEHVQVLEKQTDKPGWWYGQCSDRIGFFPSNYVREIS